MAKFTQTGSTPVPDPTRLTSDAVNAATRQVRLDMDSLRELLEARLDAMDKATDLHHEVQGEVIGRSERQMAHQKELLETQMQDAVAYGKAQDDLIRAETVRVLDVCMERFTAIEGTFASNALALTAALAAQKEAAAEQNKSGTLAITKSEQTTKETINSNAIQTTAALQSQAALITDVKERVVRIEQSIVVTAQNNNSSRDDRNEHRGDRAGVTTLISVGIAVISLIVLIFVTLSNRADNAPNSGNLPACSTATVGTECITVK